MALFIKGKQKHWKGGDSKQKGGKAKTKCYHCGGMGHIAKDCASAVDQMPDKSVDKKAEGSGSVHLAVERSCKLGVCSQ